MRTSSWFDSHERAFEPGIRPLATVDKNNQDIGRCILRTPNSAQWWVILVTIGLLIIALTVPFVRTLFHVAPLHGNDVAISVAAGALCVGWIDAATSSPRR